MFTLPLVLLNKTNFTQNKANGFNFDNFTTEFLNLFSDKEIPSVSWLSWFRGFLEGNGSFIVAKRGDLSTVITQDTRDIQVLYMIQEVLGFGRVVKQGVTTYRFIIQDKKGFISFMCFI